MKHYYAKNHNTGKLVELTEEDFLNTFGDQRTRGYGNLVIRGKLALDAVPDEYRSEVERTLAARKERFGEPTRKE